MFCPSQSPQRAGERSTKINPFSPRMTQNPLYSGTRPDFDIPEKILFNQAKKPTTHLPNKIKRNCPSARSAAVRCRKLNESSSTLQAGGLALPSAPVPLGPLRVTSPAHAQRLPGAMLQARRSRSGGNEPLGTYGTGEPVQGRPRAARSLRSAPTRRPQHRPRWAPSRAGKGMGEPHGRASTAKLTAVSKRSEHSEVGYSQTEK